MSNNNFDIAWAKVPKPLSGNKKGYKKGYHDGFIARDKEFQELKEVTKELIGLIDPILMGGYDRAVKIEKAKELIK